MTAEARGWGPAPAPRSSIVPVRLGAARVPAPGGVHRLIEPLVIELAGRWESITGDELVDGWCWGYSPRLIRGSTSRWSNHAWGLAVDLNAPRWPMGVSKKPPNADRMRAAAHALGFRWGADWSRPDVMHFEFAGTPGDARRITEGLGSVAPTLPGDTDEEREMERLIRNIQQALVDAGHDLGSYGEEGDGVDGVWGDLTQAALTAGLIEAEPLSDLYAAEGHTHTGTVELS